MRMNPSSKEARLASEVANRNGETDWPEASLTQPEATNKYGEQLVHKSRSINSDTKTLLLRNHDLAHSVDDNPISSSTKRGIQRMKGFFKSAYEVEGSTCTSSLISSLPTNLGSAYLIGYLTDYFANGSSTLRLALLGILSPIIGNVSYEMGFWATDLYRKRASFLNSERKLDTQAIRGRIATLGLSFVAGWPVARAFVPIQSLLPVTITFYELASPATAVFITQLLCDVLYSAVLPVIVHGSSKIRHSSKLFR
jgi:hypothetical protein